MRTNHGMRWPLREKEGGEGGEGGGGGGQDTQSGGGGDGLGTMEERAARMGWAPKDKFRGDAAKWTDAATFVKNGEESLPILRERLRTLERTNQELSKSVTEVRKMNDTVFQRAYDKAKKDLEGEIRKATKDGDEEAATRAAAELAGLEGEKARRENQKQEDPEFDAWLAQNRWYTDDIDLGIEAEAEAYKMHAKHKRLGTKPPEGAAFLEAVKDAVKKRFPEKFGNPRRQAAQRDGGQVEGAAPGGDGGGRGKKGWENMPAEAKKAGEGFIKQGLFKDKNAYAASYWGQFDEQAA